MTYQAAVALGVLLAFLARRLTPDERSDLVEHRPWLTLAAVLGAVLGAYGLEWPADHFGWTSGPRGPDGLLFGRTVLGGLIGGWLAVELTKRLRGVRGSTGDALALPLAVALACGRLGCVAAGCCAGIIVRPGDWWAGMAVRDAVGLPRFPAPWVEVAFHAGAAATLWWLHRRGLARGRRLTGYLAAYALLRFALEYVRGNPPVALGLTWYQWLALALLAIAYLTWRRWRTTAA